MCKKNSLPEYFKIGDDVIYNQIKHPFIPNAKAEIKYTKEKKFFYLFRVQHGMPKWYYRSRMTALDSFLQKYQITLSGKDLTTLLTSNKLVYINIESPSTFYAIATK